MLHLILLLLFTLNRVYCQITSQFTSPVNQTFYRANDLVPVILTSAAGTGSALVTQTCGENVLTMLVYFNSSAEYFNLPPEGMGTCIYTADSLPEDVLPPTPVFITIFTGVLIALPRSDSSMLAGSQTEVNLVYSPYSDPLESFDVTLTCPIGTPYTQSIEGNSDSVQLFSVPSDIYGSGCVFSVQGTPENPSVNSATGITINQQLSIEEPTNTSIYADSFPVLVTTAPDSTLHVDYVFYLTCGSLTMTSTFPTNAQRTLSFPETYFGDCTVGVQSAPTGFLIPEPVSIFILIPIIMRAPEYIYIGQPFNIEIQSAGPVEPSASFITLFLACSNQLLQTWSAVPVNQVVSLTVASTITPSNNCMFVTPDNGPTFQQTSTGVSFGSPSGGAIYPITSEQVQSFLQSIVISGGNMLQ